MSSKGLKRKRHVSRPRPDENFLVPRSKPSARERGEIQASPNRLLVQWRIVFQREAMAEGRAKDADDRTRMLMDDGRLMGEGQSQKRAPDYPKGPYYEPRDKMDRAYDTYSQYQPDRAATAAQAEQNVRIGRADETVVPGRVVTPAEDLGPRTRPIIGDPRIPTRQFERGEPAPLYTTPYGPEVCSARRWVARRIPGRSASVL